MNFQYALATVAVLLLSACASDPPAQAPVAAVTPPTKVAATETPPPPPKIVVAEKPVKVSVPKAPSPCKGAPQLACINLAGCEWIKRTAPTDKDGRPLTHYCRPKAAALAGK